MNTWFDTIKQWGSIREKWCLWIMVLVAIQWQNISSYENTCLTLIRKCYTDYLVENLISLYQQWNCVDLFSLPIITKEQWVQGCSFLSCQHAGAHRSWTHGHSLVLKPEEKILSPTPCRLKMNELLNLNSWTLIWSLGKMMELAKYWGQQVLYFIFHINVMWSALSTLQCMDL